MQVGEDVIRVAVKTAIHSKDCARYFGLASGQLLNEPTDCPLRTHPVRVADGQVWVESAG